MTRKSSTRERLLAGLLAVTLLLASFLTAQAKTPVTRPAVDVPDLVSPPNNGHVTGNPDDSRISTDWLVSEPLGIPTFEWEDVGAVQYGLEVATTPAFGESTILQLGGPAGKNSIEYTTYTPVGGREDIIDPGFGLTDDGEGNFVDQAVFYWRVRAWDDDTSQWGDYSDVWTFTRHWGYKPEPTWPEDQSTHAIIPYFSWDPVPGTSFYQIQVASDPGFGDMLSDETTNLPEFTTLGTKGTDPAYPNDEDIFWRVRAFHFSNQRQPDGGRGSEWSEVQEFKLAWSSKTPQYDTRPLPLVPPQGSTYVYRPLFCWKPVAGARQYQFFLSSDPGFTSSGLILDGSSSPGAITESNCYSFPRGRTYPLDPNTDYYWRVLAQEAMLNEGQATDEAGSPPFRFRTAPDPGIEPPVVPAMFYPPYYYEPPMAETFEDPTVALPTFVWDHVKGTTEYELCILDHSAMGACNNDNEVVAKIKTANASFTFTDTQNYPLQDGQTYYWLVRSDLSPAWTTLGNNGWKVRVDRSLLAFTNTLQILRPTYQLEGWTEGKYGQESVTYYPSFAWTAIAPIGSATYEIKIARDPNLTYLVHTAETDFPEYTPPERPEPGTYFWQVCTTGATGGDCTEVGRFIVSRNFTYAANLPDEPPELVVDGDPTDWQGAGVPVYTTTNEIGDATSSLYDLSGFYIAGNSSDWFLGVPLSPTVQLGIYIDIDHYDDHGASQPPNPGGPDTPPAHRPEWAIYWSDTISDVYQWVGSSWIYRGTLFNLGGDAKYSEVYKFLELSFKASDIDQPGSPALMLFTMNESGVVQDMLPDLNDTEAAFHTESTMPTPLFPANAPKDRALSDIERDTPVLMWRHNDIDVRSGAPLFFQTYQDDTVSQLYEEEEGRTPPCRTPDCDYDELWQSYPGWAPQVHYIDKETYVWRIMREGFEYTEPQLFIKQGYVPADLKVAPIIVSDTITYTNRTPFFNWQPVQAAKSYDWRIYRGGSEQVDPQGIKVITPYFIPRLALQDGVYTWKVWAVDAQNELSAEAAQGEFRKVSDVVEIKDIEFSASPPKLKFSWWPVDFATYYEIQIANDENFTNPETYETYSTSFTPRLVLEEVLDGEFYVRVRMVDNDDNAGPWINLHLDIGYRIYLPLTVKSQ